jgi:hypothetical protein
MLGHGVDKTIAGVGIAPPAPLIPNETARTAPRLTLGCNRKLWSLAGLRDLGGRIFLGNAGRR